MNKPSTCFNIPEGRSSLSLIHVDNKSGTDSLGKWLDTDAVKDENDSDFEIDFDTGKISLICS